MSVRILEIKAATAAAMVNVGVIVAVGSAAIRHTFRFHAGKDRIELSIADVESVMMALMSARIVTCLAPPLGFVGKSEGQTVVDLDAREEAPVDLQSKDFSEEFGGCDFVFRRYDGVVQTNRHTSAIIAPG